MIFSMSEVKLGKLVIYEIFHQGPDMNLRKLNLGKICCAISFKILAALLHDCFNASTKCSSLSRTCLIFSLHCPTILIILIQEKNLYL
jgi:hypothetical protein